MVIFALKVVQLRAYDQHLTINSLGEFIRRILSANVLKI